MLGDTECWSCPLGICCQNSAHSSRPSEGCQQLPLTRFPLPGGPNDQTNWHLLALRITKQHRGRPIEIIYVDMDVIGFFVFPSFLICKDSWGAGCIRKRGKGLMKFCAVLGSEVSVAVSWSTWYKTFNIISEHIAKALNRIPEFHSSLSGNSGVWGSGKSTYSRVGSPEAPSLREEGSCGFCQPAYEGRKLQWQPCFLNFIPSESWRSHFNSCVDTETLLPSLEVPTHKWQKIVVQSLSSVQLFATLWTAAHQASLSFTISRSLLKLMSIDLMMSSNNLILWVGEISSPTSSPVHSGQLIISQEKHSYLSTSRGWRVMVSSPSAF